MDNVINTSTNEQNQNRIIQINANDAEVNQHEANFFNRHRNAIFTIIKGILGTTFLFSAFFNELLAKNPQD
ncbi:MAG: hypothetical protein RIS64_3783, partial [Bacteroidota bacterium]